MIKNEEKITKEFCKDKNLIFYPKTKAEAEFIQRKIFEMGYEWAGSSQKIKEISGCISFGMILQDRTLYYHPSSENIERSLLCTSDQFETPFDKNDINNLSGDDLLREIFNKLSTRLDAIEQRVAAIEKELLPQIVMLDKSPMTKQSPGK